jgi:UDP-N-acetylmuramoyl-L-alanine---L-glutamate ligase
MTSLRTSGIERLRNRRVGVWGTGREGRAIIRLALDRGADVVVVQDPRLPVVGAAMGAMETGETTGSGAATGTGDPAEPTVLEPGALDDHELDIVVVSPGVSRYRPELERLRALGVEVTSATALWLEDFAGRPVIGVTGSKGKTMTAVLTRIALESTGANVGLAGNIGTPVTDFYDGPEHDAYVVEVSSFQASEVTASPRIGILTLLSPDHLDWHGSYDRYVRDKLNLFAHRSDIELAVNARSPEAVEATSEVEIASHIRHRHLYGPEGEVGVAGDGIAVDGEKQPFLTGLSLRGRHNLDNLCGAITATRLLTGRLPDFEALSKSISSMAALPSRLATIAISNGVEFVDDALASNPAGTIAALEAFEGRRVSLLAGGHDRGASLSGVARTLDAMDNAALVHLGDAGDRLAAEIVSLESKVRCLPARSVGEAVELAIGALDGVEGVVLFSPAAPTPTSDGTYVDRSKQFRVAVEQYTGLPC